jgi:aspartyl-tRNA(Asn)/glutamyl-tRNA(Gln) amidotransferase subunit A
LEDTLHEGPITRTVKDAAIMLDVMAGSHWGDRHSIPLPEVRFAKSLQGGVKGLRVAWSPDLGYAEVSRQVHTICEQAVRKFSEMGASVEEASPEFENPGTTIVTLLSTAWAAKASLFGTLDEIRDKLHHFFLDRIEPVQNLSAIDYLRATFTRQEISAAVGKFFQKYDLLLTPTVGVPAWQTGVPTGYVEEIDGKPAAPMPGALCCPFNLTGQPAASIPAGWTEDGLPVGLQIVGRHYDEATVFRAAAAFEEAQPWAHKKPPLE